MRELSELFAEFVPDIDALPGAISIAVYGTGERGRQLVEDLAGKRPDIRFCFYLDSFTSGAVDGRPVRKFSESLDALREVDLIVLASTYWRDIEKSLVAADIRNYIIFFEDPLDDSLFTTEQQARFAEAYEANFACLADERSKQVYSTCYAIRCGFFPRREQADAYRTPGDILTRGKQYLDYVNWSKARIAIDGGVYDGETTDDFLAMAPPGSIVIGFEAAPANIEAFDLQRKYEPPSRILETRALWSRPCQLELYPYADASNTSEGTPNKTGILVEAVTLDDYVQEKGLKVDLIKLDVEGAETDVLKGASRTIRDHRPQLAICIYHSAGEFITIPELLRTSLDGYTHYVLHYGERIFDETVWYAIPNECLA